MATCTRCNKEKASMFSDLCSGCINDPEALKPATSVREPGQLTEHHSVASEGGTASMIGNAITWLSLAAAILCIFMFGRVEVPSGMYSSKTQWNAALISIFAGAGVNGMFFGYLLSKVGSVLSHLERQAR